MCLFPAWEEKSFMRGGTLKSLLSESTPGPTTYDAQFNSNPLEFLHKLFPGCQATSAQDLTITLCSLVTSHRVRHRYSPLVRRSCYATRSYKRLTLIPDFAKGKKSKEDCHFHRRRQEEKTAVSVCFAVSCYRRGVRSSSETGPTKLLPWGPHIASQRPATIALNSVNICALSRFILGIR